MDREKWEELLRQKEKKTDISTEISKADDREAERVREMEFIRDGKKIYGRLHLPGTLSMIDRYPLVILCHGLGANMSETEPYAVKFAANGIAAFAFDFIGGGEDIKSDGQMTEMSVLTEAEDLNVVIDELSRQPLIDIKHIFLMGQSQGGYVATYTAAQRVFDDVPVTGLIACYPAYVLEEDARKRAEAAGAAQETEQILDFTVGSIYTPDALKMDIYDDMMRYPGDVLLMHGTEDPVVPLSFSEEALNCFPHADLIRIEGAGHGFFDADEDFCAEQAIRFVKEHMWD